MRQVKDRFCTLLSQQVTELQRKLNSLHASQTDGVGTENGPSSSQVGACSHVQVCVGVSLLQCMYVCILSVVCICDSGLHSC